MFGIVSHGQLDNGEKDALAQILTSFPNLGSIATSEFVEDGYIDYGRSWTNNFDDLCLDGDGYDYYGLYCLEGHISGIVITQAWEPSVLQNFSEITGLSYLKNVTTPSRISLSTQSLALELASKLPIETMNCSSYPTFVNGSFGYPSSLQALRAGLRLDFDLSLFLNLRSLESSTLSDIPVPGLGIWPSSLETLRIYDPPGLEPADLFVLVGNSTNLKSLTLSVGASWAPFPFPLTENSTLASESLETLDFMAGFSENYTLTVNSSSLKTASFITDKTPLVLNTPNLQKLTISQFNSVPPGFTELHHLEELSFLHFKITGPNFPNLDFAANLTSLSFEDWTVEPSELSSVLCDVVRNHSKLSSLKVLRVKAPLPGAIFEIPACLQAAHQLKSLHLSSLSNDGNYYQVNAISFVAALPPFLENLDARITFDNDTNIYTLTPLVQLKELYLDGDSFVGEMKNDFFESFPNLEKLTIASTKVNGTIPSVGWANLRWVEFWCPLNQWTGLDSAPSLKFVSIVSGTLESIPNDADLIGLQELEYFRVEPSPSAIIPTPSFWTKLPKLEYFWITDANLSGPITSSIAAPRLRTLEFANAGVCGPLPDLDIPMTFYSLTFLGNRISGTIPPSWAANLSVRYSLYLSGNKLSGTIPSSFLNKKMPYLTTINLEANYFTGPIWDISQNYPLAFVSLSYNNFNICDALSLPSTPSISYCTFMNVSVCPEEASECFNIWNSACRNFLCIQSVHVRVPSIEECIAPRATIPAVIDQCPPPGPPGFECINGQWISNGSVTIPSITLPPNAGIVFVNGNLSTNGSLTFNGIGTSIVVEGCVENLPTEIIILLTNDDDDEALKTINLLSQKGSNCRNDLSSIPVHLVQDKNNCKQVKSSTKDSSRSSLVVVFEIDSHKCNTKWIVLGSVLGGVIVLAVVGLTTVYHLSPQFRACIRSCKLKKAQ